MHNLDKFQPYNYSDKCGIYALFLKQKDSLYTLFQEEWANKILDNLSESILYVGKEQNKLSTRIQNNHLYGIIRNSTLRWTIAYMAGMNLYGIENANPSKNRKITNYDEQKITQWLLANTEFKIFETNNFKNMEKSYIKIFTPPLNINHNPQKILFKGDRTKNFIYLRRNEFENL